MVFPRHHGRPWSAKWREMGIVARAALDQRRPMLVHLVPMRRCNLACGYCNEYDTYSPPVPVTLMRERIDLLASLGAAVITISGGEPLLHPELDAIIRHIHDRHMVVTLITNGYKLGVERIRALNTAGLDRLQISIDNVTPDSVSSKSLKVLDAKLIALAAHATFDVNINTVVGAGIARPHDALVIARRARSLGFTATMGIIHNGSGRLMPLADESRQVYDAFRELNRWSLARLNRSFQDNLASGQANDWRCRAGSRYLYVCEDGLVHYCSQRRGTPGIALAAYTRHHMREAHVERKACAPLCTIACAHQASLFDRWRRPQRALAASGAAPEPLGQMRVRAAVAPART